MVIAFLTKIQKEQNKQLSKMSSTCYKQIFILKLRLNVVLLEIEGNISFITNSLHLKVSSCLVN